MDVKSGAEKEKRFKMLEMQTRVVSLFIKLSPEARAHLESLRLWEEKSNILNANAPLDGPIKF